MLLCPVCGCEKSKVYWTAKTEKVVFRRRECRECLTRYVTEERVTGRIISPEASRRGPRKKETNND